MNDNDRVDHRKSRRDFLNRTLGIAGGLAAATFVTPSRTLAAWPPGETPTYNGRAQVDDAYEMYTESEYWSEKDVEWWEGRLREPVGPLQP